MRLHSLPKPLRTTIAPSPSTPVRTTFRSGTSLALTCSDMGNVSLREDNSRYGVLKWWSVGVWSLTPLLQHSILSGLCVRLLVSGFRHDLRHRTAGSATLDRNHAGVADDLAAEFL